MQAELERAELAVARLQWGAMPEAVVREVGGLLVVSLPGPVWMTQVVGVGLVPGADLAAALDLVPSALVAVPEGAVGEGELRRLGLRPGVRLLRLAAEPVAGALPPSVVVAGPQDRARLAAVCAAGFGLDLPEWWTAPLGRPGWTQLLLWSGDTAVAAAGLHVADGVARLGAATTVPAARGQGAQTTLIAARLALAAEQRVRRVTASAEQGTSSLRNLQRAGFTVQYPVTQWARG